MAKKDRERWLRRKGFPAFGILLLIIGVVFLLQENGLIPRSFQWWPLILIALGLIFIFEYYGKKKEGEDGE